MMFPMAPLLRALTIISLSALLQAQSLPRKELRPGMVFVQAPETDQRPALWIQQTETTRAAWRAIMGTEPWKLHETAPRPGEDLPVTFVSWHDVQAFIQRLNAQDHAFTYRLPTESEWMEACRGGEDSRPVNLNHVAWYDQNAFLTKEKFTHAVAQKAPNGWGLYDCLGNVWEWIQDARDGQERLLKGGSWRTNSAVTQVEEQNWLDADQFAGDLGFRLMATPVEDGLWTEWRSLLAGECQILFRLRWVESNGQGRGRWSLNLRNEGPSPIQISFQWGFLGDMRMEQTTLEPNQNQEWHADLLQGVKGQRPAVACNRCQPELPSSEK